MIRTILSISALILLELATAPAARAGWVYDSGTGLWYGLTATKETWTQAEAEAVSLGGHLASILDQGTENFLISTFVVPSTPGGGDRQPFWIGLYDANFSTNGSNRDFVWTDGKPVTYTDWNPGEPNDNGGNEWYVAFNFHYGVNQSDTKGTWNDTTNVGSVNPPYSGIIELSYNPAAVPEPSSIVLLGTGGVLGGALYFMRRRRAAA